MKGFRPTFVKGYSVNKVGAVIQDKIVHWSSKKIKKSYLTPKGYLRVTLRINNGNKAVFVHRLVAFAFLGAPLWGQQVNHKNGIKQDNRVENLEWVTALQNERHSLDVLGKNCRGENHYNSYLTKMDVFDIRELRRLGCKYWEIACIINTTASNACRVVKGQSWRIF